MKYPAIHSLLAICESINPPFPLGVGVAGNLRETAAAAAKEARDVEHEQSRATLIKRAAKSVATALLLQDNDYDTELALELIRAGIPHPFPEADDHADEQYEARRDRAA